MILTSFYFSVGGLLALTAYAVTEYFKYYVGNASDAAKEEKRNEPREKNGAAGKNQKACEKAAGYIETAMAVRDFFRAAIRFALPVLAGILLSGILLIPSAAALFWTGGTACARCARSR